jgi:hypothetical protein
VAVTKTTTSSNDSDHPKLVAQSQAAVRFWTEQLKRAILVRYGPVGHQIDVVRRLLHHSRTVLRNPDGMDRVQDKFI